MAATVGIATPIQPYRTNLAGTSAQPMQRMAEKAAQSFFYGTPVQVDVAGSTGYIIACPAMTSVATANIQGIATEAASNLTTSGVAQTQNLTNKVANQPNATITPLGAPPNDGTVGLVMAINEQTFSGLLGNSTTDANAVLAQNMIDTIMGLTQDATTLFWYVDMIKNTTATGACVQIVSLIDPIGTLHGRVEFRITKAAQQGQV
jgi:microcystin degradation protein MlrC